MLHKILQKSIRQTVLICPGSISENSLKFIRISSFNLVESICIGTTLLIPFMPGTTEKIFAQLGTTARELSDLDHFGLYPNGNKVTEKPEILFARIDAKEMAEKIAAVEAKHAPKPAEEKPAENKKEIPGVAQIGIEDFAKVELRVAEVLDCEPIKRAKKLLKLTLNDGAGTRTVASGIAKWYKPEDLKGRHVVIVSNLKPAVLCGVESQGMILAADVGEDDVRVIFVDNIPAGSKIR